LHDPEKIICKKPLPPQRLFLWPFVKIDILKTFLKKKEKMKTIPAVVMNMMRMMRHPYCCREM